MKKIACLAILAIVVPAASWADCNYPKKPARAPDGKSATHADMVAGMKMVNKYQSDVTAYLTCLKSAHVDEMASNKTASDSEKKKMEARWEKKNDAAVDEAQDVADRFNEQLRACKARPDGCK